MMLRHATRTVYPGEDLNTLVPIFRGTFHFCSPSVSAFEAELVFVREFSKVWRPKFPRFVGIILYCESRLGLW